MLFAIYVFGYYYIFQYNLIMRPFLELFILLLRSLFCGSLILLDWLSVTICPRSMMEPFTDAFYDWAGPLKAQGWKILCRASREEPKNCSTQPQLQLQPSINPNQIQAGLRWPYNE